MATARLDSFPAIQRILTGMAENKTINENMPINDEMTNLVRRIVENFIATYKDIAESYCDYVVQHFAVLAACGPLTKNEIEHLGKYPFADHANSMIMLKEANICNLSTLDVLVGSPPISAGRLYPSSIAKAMVLLHEVGMLDEAIPRLKEHENPCVLERPLTLLKENNILRREYAEHIFTMHLENFNLVVALEKTRINFNFPQDLLSYFGMVVGILAFFPTNNNSSLLTQANFDAVNALRGDDAVMVGLVNRLNYLHEANDLQQSTFDVQLQYAAEKKPYNFLQRTHSRILRGFGSLFSHVQQQDFIVAQAAATQAENRSEQPATSFKP